jgi:hypothetical protein
MVERCDRMAPLFLSGPMSGIGILADRKLDNKSYRFIIPDRNFRQPNC